MSIITLLNIIEFLLVKISSTLSIAYVSDVLFALCKDAYNPAFKPELTEWHFIFFAYSRPERKAAAYKI